MRPTLYLVAGLGQTGHSMAAYLSRRNQAFVVFDTRKKVDNLDHFTSRFPGVDVFLEKLPATLYKQLTGILLSPGISLNEPFLQEARRHNIPCFGDIECLARDVSAPIVAITGTNGKSTVTSLVGEMAKLAGFSVAVAGNIGFPVLNFLDETTQYNLWVLELSSFQLDTTFSLKPKVATILNITPDHLNRYVDFESYVQSKQRIYQHAEVGLYNIEDKLTMPRQLPVGSRCLSYRLQQPRSKEEWGIIEQHGIVCLAQGTQCFLEMEKLHLKGKHNWHNILAACTLASLIGIDSKHIIPVLQSFKGLVHRCQLVRRLDEVNWINDSKGSNVGATISAISGIGGTMQGKIVLIAGGQGKGADFTALRQSILDFVRSVVLIGEDAEKIETALANVVPILRAPSLEKAIRLAKQEAKAGDVVLFSPFCASFDMFRDFNHRGELFGNLVSEL